MKKEILNILQYMGIIALKIALMPFIFLVYFGAFLFFIFSGITNFKFDWCMGIKTEGNVNLNEKSKN